jgi:GNAT superfamily N-acetyltransferase
MTATARRVRPARPEDVPSIHALIVELAQFEREPDAVEATPDTLRAALFNQHPRVYCHVAEVDGPEGPQIAGMALWYVTFSTWRGRHGIWLEDLYIRPDHRRRGLARALLSQLAQVCAERGYPRMEWHVLDWNESAHSFYRDIGAAPLDEWTTWRVDDAALRDLARPTS